MVVDPLYWAMSFAGAIIYWLLPGKLRAGFLFSLSFIYLATISPFGVVVLLFWSLAFYFVTPRAFCNRHYSLDVVLIWALVLFLFCVKYLFPLPIISDRIDEFSGEIRIIIPIGISYYTFKLLHYSIERRNGTQEKHSLLQFLEYMFFFPIYTAGPIERFEHFLQHKEICWSARSFAEGLTRICYGLIKKFVLVEIVLNVQKLFGRSSDVILHNLSSYTSLQIWALLLVTYLILYLDFSAYSDIAIGTARLFGYSILENFNYPVLASSIVDFWRRWHMTLAGWVQSYVYMPLVGLYRKPVLALVSAFFIIGVWHELSITRIFWGLYHVGAIILCVRWSRSRPRRIASKKQQWCKKIGGVILTQLFLITSMAFLVKTSGQNLYGCFQILAKLCGFDLPGN